MRLRRGLYEPEVLDEGNARGGLNDFDDHLAVHSASNASLIEALSLFPMAHIEHFVSAKIVDDPHHVEVVNAVEDLVVSAFGQDVTGRHCYSCVHEATQL